MEQAGITDQNGAGRKHEKEEDGNPRRGHVKLLIEEETDQGAEFPARPEFGLLFGKPGRQRAEF